MSVAVARLEMFGASPAQGGGPSELVALAGGVRASTASTLAVSGLSPPRCAADD